MESPVYDKSVYNQKNLLIDHNINNFQYHSDNHLNCKYNIEENGKKPNGFFSDKEKLKISSYYGQKEIYDFLRSKIIAMEKMNLDDKCEIGKIETRKINIDKDFFPKPKNGKNKNGSTSPKKKSNGKKNSPKKPKNKTKKNIETSDNKVEISKILKKNDLIDGCTSYANKELKQKKIEDFFSDKFLLESIIDEMKDK